MLTDDLREEWKALITQWGQDPIWKTAPLPHLPAPWNFPDAVNRRSISRWRSDRPLLRAEDPAT
jgi:hypothetical protein